MHFFICEELNLINVVGQVYFMDYFLDGEFSTYGSDVIRFAQMESEDTVDPMSRVFSKVTKCTFRNYGPSGTVQKFDGLCMLHLNVVNENIFVFLWFWFVFLSVLTGLKLLYRAVVILTPQVRISFRTAGPGRAIHRKSHIGGWFVLYRLSNNIDPFIYKEHGSRAWFRESVLLVFAFDICF
jgi:hypothetical protein